MITGDIRVLGKSSFEALQTSRVIGTPGLTKSQDCSLVRYLEFPKNGVPLEGI